MKTDNIFVRILIVAMLLVSLVGCHLRQKSTGVKLAVAVETSLGSIQDAVRGLCDAAIARPLPIANCTAESVALGLTTAKFRQISAALAKAFDFMRLTLVPALTLWQVGQPPPASFSELVALVKDVVAIARTISDSPAAQRIFDGINLVTTAVAELARQLGSTEPLPEPLR